MRESFGKVSATLLDMNSVAGAGWDAVWDPDAACFGWRELSSGRIVHELATDCAGARGCFDATVELPCFVRGSEAGGCDDSRQLGLEHAQDLA